MILNSPYISGSLTVTGNILASGSIVISGSIASASYALTSSYAINAETLDGLDSTVFVLTGSYNADSSSFNARTANLESTASILTAASGTLDARVFSLESTASILTTASSSLDAGLKNVIARTGSFATTGSNVFYGNQTVSASMFVSGSITATGQIVAQTINVQSVTSSVVYSSGSNVFGNDLSNTQTFTGSVLITGSIVTTGTICSTGNTCFGGMTIVNSCLGIGTATPASSLETIGQVTINATTNTTGTGSLQIKGAKTDANGLNITFNNSSNLADITNYYSGVLSFGTANTERMRITSTGTACFSCRVCASAGLYSNCAVGINSFNSAIPLQIKRWAGSSGTMFLIGNDNVVGMPSIVFCNDNGGGTANISLTSNCQININNSIYVCPSGFVGIGTSTPGALLDIYKCAAVNVSVISTNLYQNQGNLIQFCQNTTDGNVIGYIGHAGDSTGDFTIFNGGSKRVAISCQGAACFSCELTAKTLGTNDLILNNLNYECANYVDGTRGSWLIQEGACDLFIINQVSGKKYKFNLIEIK